MAGKLQAPDLCERLASWWRKWTMRRAGDAEVNGVGRDAGAAAGRKLGMNEREPRTMAGKWPEAPADLLTRCLDPLGTDSKLAYRKATSKGSDK